jgi:thioredoxin 1
MPVHQVTAANLQGIIDANQVVVIDFFAPWCGPCKQFAPAYENLANSIPAAVFVKVDIDQEPALVQYFGVRSVPTIVVVHRGVIASNQPGRPDAQRLAASIMQLLGASPSPVPAYAPPPGAMRR